MRGKTARPTTQSTITSITILDRSSLKTTSNTVTTFETTLEKSETTLEITNETPEARSTEATTSGFFPKVLSKDRNDVLEF